MGISEAKMKIVIDNYFKTECNVNTSIKQAFEKGFRIGVKKGMALTPDVIRCKDCKYAHLTSDGLVEYCDQWLPFELYENGKAWIRSYKGDFYCGYAERKDNGRFNQ